MPHFYIFTCGTSLLENLTKTRPEVGARLSAVIPDKESLLSGSVEERWMGESVNHHAPDALWVLDHCSKMPADDPGQTAEMTSFSKLPREEGDEFCLIASDTDKGVFCAAINAWLMSGPDGQVCVREAPMSELDEISLDWHWSQDNLHPSQTKIATGKVILLRVRELDPTIRERFERNGGAARMIRTVADSIWYARSKRLDPVLVFTGGFKASIPLLTQAVIWLGNTTMMCLYEGSRELVTIPTVRAEPSLLACRAVYAFNAQHIENLSQQELLRMDHSNKKDISNLSHDLQPFFQNSMDGQRIQLNLLGQTLREVVNSEINAQCVGSNYLGRLLGNNLR